MAKTKQAGSAAQRRAQERQQRQRREEIRESARSRSSGGRGPTIRKKDRTGLYMVIGVLVLIAAFVVAVIFLRNAPASQTNTNPNLKPKPADATVVQQVTGVSQVTWEAVGTGGVNNPFQVQSGQPPLTGPNGHPQFLYIGGEFCPNCAAERWAIVNALSRFGTFSNLSQIQSYEYNVSTFSFVGSSYTSQYVDFVPKEIKGNALDASGQNYVDLDKLTPAEQQIVNKYDTGSGIPFVDIGNRYTFAQASYSFTILLDQSQQNPLSWQAIGNALSDTKSPITKAILGTANYMTAAICNVTNQQPGNVCNSSVIQQIQHSLSQTSAVQHSGALVAAPADLVAARRRVLG